MTEYKVVLFTREDIVDSPATLVASDDKRKELIRRFSDYTNDLTIHKIAGSNINYAEMKSFYDTAKTGLNTNDIILFIDEKAYSSLPSTDIDYVITHLRSLVINSEIDVFYLANFMGNCNSITNLSSSTDIPQLQFYRDKSPNGSFALATTVGKWNEILVEMEKRNEKYATSSLSLMIDINKFKAGTSWPRVFTPNIKMIDDNVENLYSYPCRYEQDFSKVTPNTESMSFYWFIFGVIIVILGVWYLTKISPRNKVVEIKMKK
jgi:hypothetical protein